MKNNPLHPKDLTPPPFPAITKEMAIFAIILLAAIFSRFYDLGTRVMSHDESLHTYFSWLLYRGQGYEHNPMMHGPLQFHLIALAYFLFGVSDFTARIPAALFSIATIYLLWYWRRYLGRPGAWVAASLMVISPYMLFYGRYVRNEAYAGFSGLLLLYSVLRYLESGAKKYLYLLAIAWMIHFTAKETAFIYAAQILLFLAVRLIAEVTQYRWEDKRAYYGFVTTLSLGVLLIGTAAGLGLLGHKIGPLSPTEVAQPANPTAASPLGPVTGAPSPIYVLGLGGVLAVSLAAFFLLRGYTWPALKSNRSFDLLILTGTLVLPMLTAFPINFLEGWLKTKIPTSAAEVQALTTQNITVITLFLLLFFGISIAIGLLWDAQWWKYALAFWVPFAILYTTVFTNSAGFFTGTIGSLGYWLVQQGVERGSQPWYFYLLVQIPVYEFLPFLGSILALIIGLQRKPPSEHPPREGSASVSPFGLLSWWVLSSLLAYTLAGEKMPWLTYHIAWPMILLTGWGLGQILESTDWQALRRQKALLLIGLIAIFTTSFSAALLALLGPTPPFQGKELMQLQATVSFLLPAGAAVASMVALSALFRDWSLRQVGRLFALAFSALLAVLTARAAFRAAYINYDNATEYLVYAHAATGVKDVIQQATEISKRTTGGMGIHLAYDASAPDTGVSWPFVWYLRDFTNQHAFDQPTRALREATIVIVDQKNFDKIEQALGPAYYRIDYIRMWWPNQDYFGLVSARPPLPFDESYPCKGVLGFLKWIKTWDFSRVCNALLDPKIRAGILEIWLNRDYTAYAQATGHTDLTLATWQPSDEMRMYIRKDVVQQIWKYGALPAPQVEVDPYEGKVITLAADRILDSSALSRPMSAPRALAFAPDGSFYVADSRNHRILHFGPEGDLLNEWGSFSGSDPARPNPYAPPSTFNEPWGVAVGPDGSVYVTDTWNYRVQKFTPQGQFIRMWAYEQGGGFYGPRGIAVDARGRVFVVDTGNKRVVVFDADGNYITQFGGPGLEAGQFDEPVGIAIDAQGVIYITDTWNQRLQSLVPSADGLSFTPRLQWDVVGWYGQSLDNKPFIAVNGQGHVFVTDPEGFRVIEYTADGQIVRTWGDYGNTPFTFGLASGIAVDPQGHIWVSDAGNNRIMRFTLPEEP